MKKSTITFTLAVFGLVASLLAANLELSNEYKKGNITTAYTTKTLPAFRFIKSDADSTPGNSLEVDITSTDTGRERISVFIGDTGKISFHVYNDTLLISAGNHDSKSPERLKNISINASKLSGISAARGVYNIYNMRTDSLTAVAREGAQLNIMFSDPNGNRVSDPAYLSVAAYRSSSVKIFGDAVIKHANLQLNDYSKLSLAGIRITERDLQIGQRAVIELSGSSIDEFNIRGKN